MNTATRVGLAVVILIFCGSSRLLGQSSCPDAAPRSQAAITRLLTGAEYTDTRQRLALGTVSMASIRKLTDTFDAATCQRLAGVLGTQATTSLEPARWQPTYYSANGLLYIVVAPKAEPVTSLPSGGFRIALMWIPVYVVSPVNYTVKASIGL